MTQFYYHVKQLRHEDQDFFTYESHQIILRDLLIVAI
jgi:hypothetical protein